MHTISLPTTVAFSINAILQSSSKYDDVDTFVAQAVQEKISKEQAYLEKRNSLLLDLQQGEEDITAGRVIDEETFFAEIETWLQHNA
jgi:hypothetical protein